MSRAHKSKTIIAGILAATMAVGTVSVLTGCDAIKGTIGQTSIGQKALSSKTTDSSDRADCYKLVQDIDGNEYATVIWLDPMEGTKFDDGVCKQVLTQNNINWYQLIHSDAKKAPGIVEHGLLYLPASSTLADITNVSNILSGVFNAHVMTKEEYEKYLSEAPSDNIMEGLNIYERETTDYGPAAQQQQQ